MASNKNARIFWSYIENCNCQMREQVYCRSNRKFRWLQTYFNWGGHIRALCRISAITRYNDEIFNPSIFIGNNCNIGINNHIGAINSIVIGDNFLSGANCLITDHYHGHGVSSIPPNERPLYSKGPIHIGNNVHIGENVIILSGVNIGNNVTIGAGAVVTKSLPNNVIAAGNPCKIIKQ